MKAGIAILVAAAALTGCANNGATTTRTNTRELDQHNGQKLNGIFLDSIKIGSNENGDIKLLKVAYDNLQDGDWEALSGTLTLDASVLSLGSTELSQAGTVLMKGVTTQNTVIRLKVESATNADSPNSEIKLYTVSYGVKGGNGFSPLCDTEPTSNPTPAIAVAGYWDLNEGTVGDGAHVSDSSHFSFACIDSAVAKCILAGYKPWATYNNTSLANHHQACTRMIRADYCGNGVTNTANGIMIDLWDGLGIQEDTDPNWTFEAVWTVDGAACVDNVRHYGDPWCVSTCPSNPSFSSTNLLMNRFE